MKTLLTSIFIFVASAFCSASDNQTIVIGGLNGLDPDIISEQHSVLLALSGGGARGFTTIGILKAFQEKNIRIDAVAGTSMGGIIGGLFACGYNPEQLDSIIQATSFENLFSNSPPRRSMFLTQRQDHERHLLNIRFRKFKPVIPKGLTAGQELSSLLTSLTSKANYQCRSDFLKLSIPFSTICTDIVTGDEVIMNSGSIADAMRATMAFPLAFTGLNVDGRILMDGGMVAPIPVDLVRQLSDSVDFVVSVNTASDLLAKDELLTPFDIASQATSIMTFEKLKEELNNSDYVIQPPIEDYTSLDFDKKRKLIEIGYQSGLAAADDIIKALDARDPEKQFEITGISFENVNEQVKSLALSLKDRVFSKSELIRELKDIVKQTDLFKLKAELIDISENGDERTKKELILSGSDNLNFDSTTFTFAGNRVFSDSVLASQFLTDDRQITRKVVKDGLRRIIDIYNERGYDLAYLEKVEIEPDLKIIMINIDEAIVHDISIKDNERTKDWFVRSLFPLKTGSPYSTEQAARGIRNIYATNLFDRVSTNILSSPNGPIVQIVVQEKAHTQLRMGWHYNDEYQSEEFAELLDDNIAGIGLETSLHANYATRRRNFSFNFKTDRIFSTYLTSQISVFHSHLDRNIYDNDEEVTGRRAEKTSGIDLEIGQQLARLGKVSAMFSLSEVRYTDSLESGKLPENKYGIRSLTLESLVENFDQIPFTTKGNRHIFKIQTAGKYLGGDIDFTKFYTSHEMYIPFGDYINFHPRISLGISRSGLPPTEKFYLGGFHSFAGFREHQLAGDKMFNFSNELRFKLPFSFYLTFKYDLGEVYSSVDQIKLRNLRNSFGAAISLDTPIGPAELAYGIANRELNHVYFNLGYDLK